MSFPIMSSSPTLTTTANEEMTFTLQPLEGRRVLRPARSAPHPYIPRNPSSRVLRRNSSASAALTTFGHKPAGSNARILPAIDQNGQFKFCDNCVTAVTPSWRRHPETQKLLCNACGLYLRLHRRARPITMDDSGQIQVIRKNAAVQREPINMPQHPMYSSRIPSQHGNVGLAFNYMPQPSSQPMLQATNTTLSGLQGLDNQHLLTDNSQHMNGLSITPENDRLIPGMVDNMLQLNIVDNRMAMSPVHGDMGWLQDVYSSHQNIPSPDTKPDNIQAWSKEDQKH
ncbi:hypothetical protein H4S08_001535 [Coemansia sp. RSA 1365]|nr:hypothetical protein H4S08_001535 [Coemansia sp. RSA 1365]